MQTDMEKLGGRLVLTLAHVAGMIDLVALPVWVGTALIGQYHLSPPVAGGMVTGYLAAAVAASLVFSSRFNRMPARRIPPLAFTTAALCFIGLAHTTHIGAMFALHVLAGFSAGTGLSFIHGIIGGSARPHRLFAIVSTGLGFSSIVFLGTAQGLIPVYGGYVVFVMFACVMGIAAFATAVALPQTVTKSVVATTPPTPPTPVTPPLPVTPPITRVSAAHPMDARVWWPIAAITSMAVTQSMMFSFLERIGVSRGFGGRVQGVLIALACANLIAPVLAGVFERRANPMRVALAGALVQACLVVLVVYSGTFIPYAIAGSSFVATMIVTHTFVFGWLSVTDDTRRAVALTPAMLMSGAAVGPLLGGVLVERFGTGSIGAVALTVGIFAAMCYFKALRTPSTSVAVRHAVSRP